MKQLQKDAELSLAENDMKWRQRAKQHWLINGDRNTTYFHMQANQRRKTNAITAIEDGSGRTASDQREIRDIFTGSFSSLFSSSMPINIDTCLNVLEPRITQAMGEGLVQPFTMDEVKKATFQMNPLGSPGPDGFPAQFYQKHWELVGREVSEFALGVLNHGGFLDKINDTYIALIPKVKNPKRVTDFRPINLCNVLLRSSPFNDNKDKMKERFHGTQVGYEQSIRYGGVGFCGSCDDKNWFSSSMGKSGPEMYQLSVLRNSGEWGTSTEIHPYKRDRGNYQCSIGRGPIKLSHLFFVDDSLLFCQASPKELIKVIEILDIYEQASGQVLNKDKSSVFFNKNTMKEGQDLILQLAGIKSNGSFEKYLGLPAVLGRAKVAAFHSLIDRTWSLVVNWKTNHLSSAGKEVLLKAVLQAIPTYSMGMFLLPHSITQKLNQLFRKFWDFRMFNLAMLAKQSWRMIQDPNSLASCVMKQKYYPTGNLLKAKLGSSPSYVWRSMMAGLSILKSGLRWRVGNGNSINLWSDKWIPSLPPFTVTSPRDVDCWCERVSDLIDPRQRSWKKELLVEMFLVTEIQAI
ncbi:uncharacterized protein LOC122304684 [Carya illinoinensis]|uniref:uncharacterized protein LOC122304684 n=1 Tax=Carya illinoinensis TaxID=32201 RepID=UPI001C728249|nr:uncharacterized protein LOC122304684 [Carya illinoinensis]